MAGNRDILQKLYEITARLNPAARETVLEENLHKHALEIKLMLEKSGQAGRVLDVGGGMGVNLLCLRKLEPALELHLIDRFEEYTAGNRMGTVEDGMRLLKDSGISVISQDFWQKPVLPYESGYFDVVTCLDVFEHLPGHPLKLLAEMHRVLKKDGAVIISGPNAVSLLARLRLLLGRQPYIPLELWCGDKYYSHYREYTRSEFRRLLEMSGFSGITTIMELEPSCRKESRQSRNVRGLAVTAAVWLIYLATVLLPGLRPSVHAVARKSAIPTS